MSGYERPWCCPEPKCTPLHQLANRRDLSRAVPGDTFHCEVEVLGWGDHSRATVYL